MRGIALIVLLLALAGCNSNPPLPDPPQVVRVIVKVPVAVPAELSKPCDEVAKRSNSYGEAIRLANARKASIEECNKRLAEIRALGKQP